MGYTHRTRIAIRHPTHRGGSSAHRDLVSSDCRDWDCDGMYFHSNLTQSRADIDSISAEYMVKSQLLHPIQCLSNPSSNACLRMAVLASLNGSHCHVSLLRSEKFEMAPSYPFLGPKLVRTHGEKGRIEGRDAGKRIWRKRPIRRPRRRACIRRP